MSAIDDLLSRRRRGALSETDERRLQMAVQTSDEHRVLLLAGEAFERAGAPQPGDAVLVKSIVRQVEGEWSGTFQRVVARRRLSRWVSVPVLIAGVAAASFGGYRGLRAPAENPRPVAVEARGRALVPGATPRATPELTPEVAVAGPAAPALAALRGTELRGTELRGTELRGTEPQATHTRGFGAEPAAELPARPEALVESFFEASPLALAPPAALPTLPPAVPALPSAVPALPPAQPQLAATPAAAGTPGAALPAAPTRSWRLPRPKPHAERVAEADRDLDRAAGMPALAAPVAAAAGGAELEPLPDLESSRVLFRRANQLRRTDWDAAASLYARLALRHSESREAGVAEMALGKHALAEGRARQALQWFEAYLRRAGAELAAEAVWGKARALENLGENERARELWRQLIEQYPASAYAAAARQQLGP
ncbi:MAG: tetratricopeptide repeat protein [Deltaproteobacteria bacterium]